MNKRAFAYCAAVFLSAGLYAAGCNDTITAKNCSGSCQDIDNTCLQKCNDDQCRTLCKTDLDNCTVSCGTITVSPSNQDGG
jgi:hypothetical protein